MMDFIVNIHLKVENQDLSWFALLWCANVGCYEINNYLTSECYKILDITNITKS